MKDITTTKNDLLLWSESLSGIKSDALLAFRIGIVFCFSLIVFYEEKEKDGND
jgi:hypothetical protein